MEKDAADLAPQQVDIEKLKREVSWAIDDENGETFQGSKFWEGIERAIDYLASRNLLANNPQAAPDNAGDKI